MTRLSAFIGLYPIACPTSSTCHPVGYDSAEDDGTVTTITNGCADQLGVPAAAIDVTNGWYLNGIDCPAVCDGEAVGENGTAKGQAAALTAGLPPAPGGPVRAGARRG